MTHTPTQPERAAAHAPRTAPLTAFFQGFDGAPTAAAGAAADDWRSRRVRRVGACTPTTSRTAGTVVQASVAEVHEFLGLHRDCACIASHVRVVWDDGIRTWTRRQDLTPSGPDDPAAAPVTVQLAVTVDAARWAAVRGVALPAAADDLAAYLREQVESELVGPLHPALLAGAVSVEHAPADAPASAAQRPSRFLCDACLVLIGVGLIATCKDGCPQDLDHDGTCDPAAYDDSACQRCGTSGRLHAVPGRIDDPYDEEGLRAHIPAAVGDVQITDVVDVHIANTAGAPAHALVIGRVRDEDGPRYSSYALYYQADHDEPWFTSRIGHWSRTPAEARLFARAAYTATRAAKTLGLALTGSPATRSRT